MLYPEPAILVREGSIFARAMGRDTASSGDYLMAIVDDFPDIASRMKGELAPKRKEAETKQHLAQSQCYGCHGRGLIGIPGMPCGICYGTGFAS